MYSRFAKGGEKGDPNHNPWLAKMIVLVLFTFLSLRVAEQRRHLVMMYNLCKQNIFIQNILSFGIKEMIFWTLNILIRLVPSDL